MQALPAAASASQGLTGLDQVTLATGFVLMANSWVWPMVCTNFSRVKIES